MYNSKLVARAKIDVVDDATNAQKDRVAISFFGQLRYSENERKIPHGKLSSV